MTTLQQHLAHDHPPARRFISALSRSAADVLDHPVLRNHSVLLAALSTAYEQDDAPTRAALLSRLNAQHEALDFKQRVVVRLLGEEEVK